MFGAWTARAEWIPGSPLPQGPVWIEFPCPTHCDLSGPRRAGRLGLNYLPARDHSVRAIAGRRFSWHNSIGSTSGWGAPGAFDALANSFAFADFCGAVRRNARGLGAIADFLPLVFAQRPVEHEQLLLHQQRAMPADDKTGAAGDEDCFHGISC